VDGFALSSSFLHKRRNWRPLWKTPETPANFPVSTVGAAKLTVALQNDTGNDNATKNDRITTDAKLVLFGYNSGKQQGIEMSINGGPWAAFDQARLTPTDGVQTIKVKVR